MTKAIVVSPEEYFDFFQQAFPDWDVQYPVLSVDQMWNDLGDEKLDDESEIVVLNDIYHDSDQEQLELAIITLAADACVLIISDPEYQKLIQDKINAIAERRNIPNVFKFWFISRNNPFNEIITALEEYKAYVPQREHLQKQQETLAASQTQLAPDGMQVQNDNYGFSSQNTEEYYEQPATQAYEESPHAQYVDSSPQYSSDNSQFEARHVSQDVIQGRTPAPVATQGRSNEDYGEVSTNQPPISKTFAHESYAGDGYNGAERNGMIIASTSSKGGSGKSTVGICTASMIYHSTRLAHEAGESPRALDVIIVDMDTRDGQIGFFLGESTPTVLNIFTSQDFSRNNIKQNLVYNERLGIYALLAPKRARTADYTTPEFYRDIISKLRTMFDIIILDTSVNYANDPLVYDLILPISDAVILVTDMSKGAVFGMTRWITEVTLPIEEGGSAAISKDKIGVVVNKSMGNVGFDQGKLVEAASGVPLIASIPMDSGSVLAATNNNHLDDIILRHNVLSPAYFSLVSQIIQNSVPIKQPEVFDPTNTTGESKKPPLPKKKKRGLFGK